MRRREITQSTMCGIGFILGSSSASQSMLDGCLATLRRRGPDASSDMVIEVEAGGVLHLMVGVLHLRGEYLHPQPAQDSDGNVLLWNGEVFDGLQVGPSESDTGKVLQALSKSQNRHEVMATLSRISGPFSFVYWCPLRRELYYGRDAIGRRSLVARWPRSPEEPLLVLSCLPGRVPELAGYHVNASSGFPSPSSNATEQWEEISAGGVYSLSLGSLSFGGGVKKENPVVDWRALSPKLHAWPGVKTRPLEADALKTYGGDNESSAETGRGAVERSGMSPSAVGLLSRLIDSIDRRVRSIPSFAESKAMPEQALAGAGEGEEARAEEERGATFAGSSGFDGGSAMMDGRSVVDNISLLPRARVGILFSGGLDSVVLAGLLAKTGVTEGRGSPIPPGEPIDLINVCFDSPTGHSSPDRLASMAAVGELRALFPDHVWRLVCVDASYENVISEGGNVWRVMQPCNTTMDFNIAAAFYFASRGRGWLYQSPTQPPLSNYPQPPMDPVSEAPSITRASLEIPQVAASRRTDDALGVETRGVVKVKVEREDVGGSDRGTNKVNKNLERLCPVGACRRLLKPGCAFGVCSKCCLKTQGLLDAAISTSTAEDDGHSGPDAARGALKEETVSERQCLCKAYAAAEALRALEDHLLSRFVELSAPFRAGKLASLLRGRGDLSTKWCPAHKKRRPKGRLASEGASGEALEGRHRERSGRGNCEYTSGARVLLVGIGADEFMGGYSRHRNAYRNGGPAALSAELQKDQARLWKRNLGRDDRCIADHGREARFPYLDEGVVGHLRSLPLRDVCNMDEPPGIGDKKILREVAGYLGLKSCRSLPKRAIQFGSRIAQHCAQHTHGSHRRGSGTELAVAFDS